MGAVDLLKTRNVSRRVDWQLNDLSVCNSKPRKGFFPVKKSPSAITDGILARSKRTANILSQITTFSHEDTKCDSQWSASFASLKTLLVMLMNYASCTRSCHRERLIDTGHLLLLLLLNAWERPKLVRTDKEVISEGWHRVFPIYPPRRFHTSQIIFLSVSVILGFEERRSSFLLEQKKSAINS